MNHAPNSTYTDQDDSNQAPRPRSLPSSEAQHASSSRSSESSGDEAAAEHLSATVVSLAEPPSSTSDKATSQWTVGQSVGRDAALLQQTPQRNGDGDDATLVLQEDIVLPSCMSSLPTEAITRILSFLDPLSLFRAALVCRSWARIARDDSTWRRAFVESFGIGGALRRTDRSSWKGEFVARVELARRWRKSRSGTISSDMRLSTIHSLAYSLQHNFLVAASEDYGVASRSSDPFHGKIARGFLDAAGLLNGGGIGNPNAEFSPDVTIACVSRDTSRIIWGFRTGATALTSMTRQGSSPRGLIRNVRFSPSQHSHLGSVTAATFDLNHLGQVRRQQRQASLSAEVGECFVTGGQDGRVCLWTPSKSRPLWSDRASDSSTELLNPLADSLITCIDFDADRGTIVAGTETGALVVWSQIDLVRLLRIPSSAFEDLPAVADLIPQSQVEAQNALADELTKVQKTVVYPTQGQQSGGAAIVQVRLDPNSNSEDVVALIRRSGKAPPERLVVSNVEDHQDVQLTALSIPVDVGAITSLRVDFPSRPDKAVPFLSPAHTEPAAVRSPNGSIPTIGPSRGATRDLVSGPFAERTIVLAGTGDGRLIGWTLDHRNKGIASIPPAFLLACHHTAVTAIDVTTHLILVGTRDGLVKAFDSLTGDLVRSWADRAATKHLAKAIASGEGATADEIERFTVSSIIANEDYLLASIGPWVLAWRPESASSHKRNERATTRLQRPLHTPSPRSTLAPMSKHAQMRELRNDLAESSALLQAEKEKRQQSYNRLQYARGAPEVGGLDEDEALEYALLLSRESAEEDERRKQEAGDVQLSELARIRKEEAELQDALERIALAEADDSLDHDHSSSRSSTGGDQDDEYSVDDSLDEAESHSRYLSPSRSRHGSQAHSPGPSPTLSGLSSPSASVPRAWNILHAAGSSASPTAATARSRWGEHSKVRMMNVPISARMSLSPPLHPSTSLGSTPPALDSVLSSPEHWPSVGGAGGGKGDRPSSSNLSSRHSSFSGLQSLEQNQATAAPPHLSGEASNSSFSLGPPRLQPRGSSWTRNSTVTAVDLSGGADEGRKDVKTQGKGKEKEMATTSGFSVSPSPAPSTPANSQPNKPKTNPWSRGLSASILSHSSPSPSPSAAARDSHSERTASGRGEEMDDDLRFAIELSLAEERSRAG